MKALDKRLQLVAEFVEDGCLLADIGTDHAYLPVYLMEQNRIVGAIAADLREGPLGHARETVEKAGLLEQIQLRLSDGLDAILPEEVTCVVMAGMGGILITQLINRATWLKDKSKTLVLQPMTDAPLVRSFLAENGFELIVERATGDKKHAYTVMKAVYSGVCQTLTPLQALVGKLDRPLGEKERRFLQKEERSLAKQIRGLRAAGRETEAAQLAFLYGDLLKVIEGDIIK